MRFMAVVTAACVLMLPTAQATPSWEIDEKALPPGMTAQQARKLLAASDAATVDRDHREQQAWERRAQQMGRVTQKYEPAYRRAVSADAALAQQQAQLEARIKALAGAAEADHRRLSAELAGELKSFRGKVLATAGIDEAALQNEIRAALADGVAPRGEAGADPEVSFTEDGAVIIGARDEAPKPPSPVEPRGVFRTVTLSAPFPYAAKERNVGDWAGSWSQENGAFESHAEASFLSGTNKVSLAHSVEVPAGTRNIRVRAELPGIEYSHLVGGLWGGAGAGGRSLIQASHLGGTPCAAGKTHPGVWLIVAGFFKNEGLTNLFMDCTFPSPGTGKQILVTFTGSTSLTNVGNTFGLAENTGMPRNIRVDFIN